MKRKKTMFAVVIFFLVSIVNLNAGDYEQSSSFKQLIKEINEEGDDTLLKPRKNLQKMIGNQIDLC